MPFEKTGGLSGQLRDFKPYGEGRKAPEGAPRTSAPAKPSPDLYRVWVHFSGIISITNGPGPGLAHAWPITTCAATKTQIYCALTHMQRSEAVFHRDEWLAVDLVLGHGNGSDFDQFKNFEVFSRRFWAALSRELAGNHDD